MRIGTDIATIHPNVSDGHPGLLVEHDLHRIIVAKLSVESRVSICH